MGTRAVALSTLGLPASGAIAEKSENERDKREMRSEGEGGGMGERAPNDTRQFS
jgi:hypothetical protein